MTPEFFSDLPLAVQILGWFAVFWGILALSGAAPLIAVWNAKVEQQPAETSRKYLDQVLSSGKVSGDWAIETGFEPMGVFKVKTFFLSPMLVGWKLPDQNTYLCVYVIAESRIEIDIVSKFSSGSHLTTGTTRDGQTVPVGEENWLQSFSVSTATELWQHHREGLEYLDSTRGIRPANETTSIADDFIAAMQHQKEFVQSMPLWFLRIPYWYFVRRLARHNKPISKLA